MRAVRWAEDEFNRFGLWPGGNLNDDRALLAMLTLLRIGPFISAYQGGQFAGPVRVHPFRHPCFAVGGRTSGISSTA
jgi:hypothetical protein